MTNDEAYNALTKIIGLYNKNLSDEYYVLWLEELKLMNVFAVHKAIKTIKTDRFYESNMPTLPQFLSLYRTYINTDNTQKSFCYVCYNRGYEILREYVILNDKKMPYDYTLHCDFCDLGNSLKINHKNYCTEPISKYFNPNELIIRNKKKYEQMKKKLQIENSKMESELKKVYIALSL